MCVCVLNTDRKAREGCDSGLFSQAAEGKWWAVSLVSSRKLQAGHSKRENSDHDKTLLHTTIWATVIRHSEH